MNLARLVEEHVEKFGDYEAVWFEEKWYSTGETAARTRAVAAGLQELGVGVGDRVVVYLPNCPEVSITYWAAWRIGAAVTPVIFLLPPEEIRRIVEDSGAVVAVTSAELLANLQGAIDGIETLKAVVSVGGGGDGAIDFSELETKGEAEMIERDPNDLAALLYTGGTTGSSKGVMSSINNLEWTARAAMKASEIEPDSVGLLALPLSHSFGLHVSIVGALERGTGALMRWFDPNGMLDLIEKHQVRRMAVVPTMLQMLLALPLEERNLSSLESITSGAAGLPHEVQSEWERRVPTAPILQGYGLTETSPTCAVQPPSSVRDGTRRIGSVGKVVDGVQVRITGENGEALGTGEVGEIAVKGPNVMQGYWRNEEATAGAVVDGWFHTGDMGRMDEEGNLFIVERKKDLIIRGGFNVFPADVEGVLLEHPSVAEAAVVGRESAKFGEEPVALIVASPGAENVESDLMAYCEEKLAKYKRPVEIRLVDEIPKTAVGKIDKKLLRARL
jgi:long-chain acyl-CoA synthetase